MKYELAAEQPISVEIATADDVFIKSMLVQKAGSVVPQHAHKYGHTSMLAVGSVNVFEDGVFQGEYHAPKALFIKANVLHRFETLEDNTLIYCIHNTARKGVVEVEREHDLFKDH